MRVGGLWFQVSGFGFQVSGFKFQVSGFRLRDEGLPSTWVWMVPCEWIWKRGSTWLSVSSFVSTAVESIHVPHVRQSRPDSGLVFRGRVPVPSSLGGGGGVPCTWSGRGGRRGSRCRASSGSARPGCSLKCCSLHTPRELNLRTTTLHKCAAVPRRARV